MSDTAISRTMGATDAPFLDIEQTDDEYAEFMAEVHASEAADVFRRAVARYTPTTTRLHEAYCHSEAFAHQERAPGTPCYWCAEICDTCQELARVKLKQFVDQFIEEMENEHNDSVSAY